MISTRDLSELPDVERLRKLLQSMAMLDAILSRWGFRMHSFNAHWSDGEQMGSMDNGSGDDYFVLFNAYGCFFKGFAHEAPMSPYRDGSRRLWDGLIESVPKEFAKCLDEPAFNIEDTTFCIWRRFGDLVWQRGAIEFPAHPDPDGSAFLLSLLDGKPETYLKWANRNYNKPFLTAEMVRHAYQHRPLTDELVAAFAPVFALENEEKRTLKAADLEEDIKEIGYPL